MGKREDRKRGREDGREGGMEGGRKSIEGRSRGERDEFSFVESEEESQEKNEQEILIKGRNEKEGGS